MRVGSQDSRRDHDAQCEHGRDALPKAICWNPHRVKSACSGYPSWHLVQPSCWRQKSMEDIGLQLDQFKVPSSYSTRDQNQHERNTRPFSYEDIVGNLFSASPQPSIQHEKECARGASSGTPRPATGLEASNQRRRTRCLSPVCCLAVHLQLQAHPVLYLNQTNLPYLHLRQ